MSDGVNFVQFPPWDQMNFSSDCNIWGNWLGVVLTPNPSQPDNSIGPAFTASIDLFTAALPTNATLPENTTLQEYHSQILDWYIFNSYDQTAPFTYGPWNLTTEFFTNVLAHPALDYCTNEYCQAMGMQGNADLTGIGVFISYIIEAALATMYLIAFTAWHIRRYFRPDKGKGRSGNMSPVHAGAGGNANGIRSRLEKLSLAQRALDSFRGSVGPFLSSAMLISLAMLCASIYLCVHGMNNQTALSDTSDFPYQSSARYDMLLSFRASFFSVLPILLLCSLESPDTKEASLSKKKTNRAWMRRIVLVVIWILGTVQTFLSPRGNPDYNSRHNVQNDPCDVRGGASYWRATEDAMVGVIVVPVVWMVITAFFATGFGIPNVAGTRWIRRLRSVWRLGFAWVVCGLMWAMLFFFLVLRYEILSRAGSSDSQNEWGFGQVLALATWVPVVAEFGYIFLWGTEESPDTHLPPGFQAQRLDSDMPRSYRYSTVGPDPFQVVEEPAVGNVDHPSSSDGMAKPLSQRAQPYQQGEQMMSTSVPLADLEGQPAPHVYHHNEQWSRTGW